MKTEKVVIKDFKVLKNIEKEVNGNHILLLGDNGVGKSSFIQFIKIALGDQSSIPPNATGEGEVIVSKDGKPYKFTVKFKDGKPIVTVTTPDGLKDNKKGTIAGIVGAMDFDIDSFVELSKTTAGQKKQVEIFKSFLSDDIKAELLKYESDIRINYDERTDVNKKIKEKESVVKNHYLYNVIDTEKFEQVKVEEVYSELKLINEHNEAVEKKKTSIEADKKSLLEQNERLEKYKAEIAKIEITVSMLSERIAENESDILMDPKKESELKAIEDKLKTANEANKKFNDSISLKKDIELLKTMEYESNELTKKIESSRELLANTIRDMESPIAGLSFDENDRLIYNGIPVTPDTLSTSEIMELGIRLKMAENPDLGILFIERGESLGTDRLKLIHDIANKSGWQIIMEQVERGKKELNIELTTE